MVVKDDFIRFRIEAIIKNEFKERFNYKILRLFVYELVKNKDFIKELNLKDEELVKLMFDLLKEEYALVDFKIYLKALIKKMKKWLK